VAESVADAGAPDEDRVERKTPADKIIEELDGYANRVLTEKRSEVVAEGKRISISDLAQSKELLAKLDFGDSRTLSNADLLLEQGLLSSKDLGDAIARKTTEDYNGLYLLKDIPRDTLVKLQKESTAMNLKMEELAKFAVNNLDRPGMKPEDIVFLAARIPGAIAMAKRTGTVERFMTVAKDFAKSASETPDRILTRLQSIGLDTLFDAAGRGFFGDGDPARGREEIVGLVKQSVAATSDAFAFRSAVIGVRELEQKGRLSHEEAEAIIRSNPHVEKLR
jgi:hypothetical protein